ncbi:MAG: gliding motility-associated C-terminal domain-containing protein [Bacteroidetes bacterium]|nr:gliding motility-associated C-terminal domain-containing protein [Bacteroidota bacterium]
MRSTFIIFLGILLTCARAQTITRAEYFFDTDPGKGNGTSVSVVAGSSIDQTYNVSISSLTEGYHTFSYRVLDSNGHWSLVATRTFFIVTPVVFATATTIKRAEYFFDTDPGTGAATPLTITPAATENNSFMLNVSSLSAGFHQLMVRYQDDLGRWSLVAQRTFYIVPPVVTTNSIQVRKAEYFFDTDPGMGNGTALTIAAAGTENNLFTIPISSLSPGFHTLSVRYQDDHSKWTLQAARTFYIVPPSGLVSASNITKAEYFFDHDPGTGKGTALVVSAGASQNNTFTLDVSALTTGFHQLNVRYQDNLGHWSIFNNRTFYVFQGSVATTTLERLEYYIDTDPGFGKATSLSFSPAAQVNQQFNIDLTSVSNGKHKLYLRTKDSKGYWSAIDTASFTILNCTPPTAPMGLTASRCGTGTVTLNASGATGSQVYRWHVSDTTSNILYTGTSFTTPSISKDTSYFVSIYDPTTLCESSRTETAATIVNIPKPTLNLSGTLSVCPGNSETLVAPPGFAGYTWSNGLTTQQITIATTGKYAVQVSNGTCTSPPSDSLTFTVNAKPVKPVIQATGGGTLCGGGSVTLSAPTGFSKYSWSSGDTTQSITVNTTGNFIVTVTNANGCQSDASEVASITSSALAKPIVTVTGDLTLCNGSIVSLSAPSGFAHYTWSSGDTTKTINISNAGNYSVVVSTPKCSSPNSDTVRVASAGVPPTPVIQITGTTTLCNNAFVGLSAPTGFSSYRWSDGETSRQIIVSTAGNYSVQVGQAVNCLSTPSDTVNVTLTGKPCGTSGGTTTNAPPKIADAIINIPVGTVVVFDLKNLITQGSIGIEYSTLQITQEPTSGSKATLDTAYNLVLDYTGISFVGNESISIQVCDSLNSCTERTLTIDVVASVEVFNAVSPFQDGLNDFFNLKYIDKIEDTKKNKVVIVDRWGNEVFSISDYNNNDHVFRGVDNNGKELPSGTYYYRIDFTSGRPTLTGFLSLKR